MQREPQFLGERVHGRSAALPGALGLEPKIADPAAPRGNDAPDGPEVAAVGVFLIQAADDVGRHANEGAQSRSRFDRVLPAVPRASEHERDLLEIDRKSTRLNSSHIQKSRMPSSA